MRNARAAGVDDRVHVQVADMRTLPFDASRFDAAFSVAAIDHLPWDGIAEALRETARVLRPGRAVADREPQQRRMGQGGDALVDPRPRVLGFDPEPAPMDGGARRRRLHACRDRDGARPRSISWQRAPSHDSAQR